MIVLSLVIVVSGLVLAKSNTLTDLQVDTNLSLASTGSSDTVYPEPWISDLFYRALVNFTVRNVGSTLCQKQVDMFEKNLRNHTNWAVKMSESWDRRPIGILEGNRYHLGIYDECVGVRHPIIGRYCISEVKLIPTVKNNNISSKKGDNLDRVYNSNAWKAILEWNDYPYQYLRNVLKLGICIPDSCTASDLQTSLQRELNKVFLPEKVNAIVKVEQIMCTTKEDKYPYDTAFYITRAIFGLLIMICCVSTIHHYTKLSSIQIKPEGNEKFDSFFDSFSFIKSMNALLEYNEADKFNFVYGYKVVLILSVLIAHRMFYLMGNPLVNATFGEDFLFSRIVLLSLVNSVDTFFFISGLLMSFYSAFDKSGPVWMKLAFPIIQRMFRFLPAYCALIAITAHIIPHLGDGPLWPRNIWEEADNCTNYWWANVLFISNFINSKYQCLIVSWYISCDIQFHIIGVIIVYVYTKHSKYGKRLLITVLGLSFLIPFLVILYTRSDGFLKIDIPLLENLRGSVEFNTIYRASYMRGAPYFIGLTMGLVFTELKSSKFELSRTVVYGGTFVVTGISIWIQCHGFKFYSIHRPYYPLERAIYAVLVRCTWFIVSAWIVLYHFTIRGGLLHKIMSYRGFVVFGRLSYSVMLINLTVMIMSQSTQKTPHNLSFKSVFDEIIHDSFKSYLMGLMLYLFVEAPFGNITKKLLGRGKYEIQPKKPLKTS